jgi:hypothetical protein
MRPTLKQNEVNTMKTYNDNTTLTNFKFWSGAEDNASCLTYAELEELDSLLEELYPEGMEETQLNDLMWFEFDSVCELLGLDIDEVYER